MADPHDAFSIAVADWTAVGHANVGFGLYRSLEAHMRANGGKLPEVPELVPIVVPAVTNMAFAIELLIKVHAFQVSDVYPSGHNIAVLSKGFSPAQLNNLRHIYKSFLDAPQFLNGFVLDLSGGPKTKPGIPAAPASSPQTYDEAVAEVGASYVEWRYVYEGFGVEAFRKRISFPTLWILIQTLRKAIQTQKGPTTIKAVEATDEI